MKVICLANAWFSKRTGRERSGPKKGEECTVIETVIATDGLLYYRLLGYERYESSSLLAEYDSRFFGLPVDNLEETEQKEVEQREFIK